MGRHEEARKSLAWALMIDPNEIALPASCQLTEQTRWLELFKYPRLVAAGCLTGLTQTGGASLGPVGGDAARDRPQHDPGACGVSDGICWPVANCRPFLHPLR